MEEKTSFLSDDISSKLDRIIFDYYFSLSTIAASKGKLNLASDYLSELLKSNGESVRIFDLQAKIAAQQGRYKEAEFLWKKCLNVEADNPHYLAALHRLSKLRSYNANRFTFVFKLSQILLILLFLSFFVYLLISDKNFEKENKNELALIVKNQDLIANRIDSIISSKETINSEIFDLSNKIKSIGGISVHENKMKLTLNFNEGLFSGGIGIKSNQIETIHQLSKVLSPFAGKINVKIIGSSDDIPVTNNKRFQNNEELSLSRAKVVYDIINGESKIPREDLSIGSLSALNSVYPNDSPENRLKNRTVIINITQK
ncbi:MAG: hypothetical protein ACQETL_18535 [Bacteroidota bacterium]